MSPHESPSSPALISVFPGEESQSENQRVEDPTVEDPAIEGELAPVDADPGLVETERVNANDLPAQDDERILPVVGLGGSAGSIGALQEFFGRIPTNLGIAYVVVVHLSTDFESQLPQVLRARTRMPVVQVQESVKVEADHVYVIPPAYHLRMDDGRIHLSPPEQERGKRVAVDLFFRTLAASHRSRAVAVVLSGLDGDGAIGIKRIKEHGGVTIAQDPDEAEHEGMPRSAIETGMVDWILSVEQMAGKLAEWISNERKIHLPPAQIDESAPPLSGEEADETALREVLGFLHTRTGHDFAHYKRATVLRRIMRRLQVNSLESLPQYANFLRTHPGESGALLQDLLISVTNFFRDPEAFLALSNFMPRFFRDKKPSDAVRAWVAGCATGEEAYSLAILLDEYAQTLENPPEIQIFASDLDEQALRTARDATYPATIAADVSPDRLRRYFVLDGGRYRVKKELRERVLFAAHNLLSDSPFSRLDLVSCRNLLIYFGREAQDKVLDVFHFALKPNGTLFLGGSESADENALFKVQDKKHRIYERQTVVRSQMPILSASLPKPRTVEIARFTPAAAPVIPFRSEPAPSASASASFSELHLRLLEQSAPPSVLVDTNYEIVHLSEHAGRFLHLAGEATMNLLPLVHPALRLELRTALFRAVQTGEDVNIPAIPLEINGRVRRIGARVRPLHEREENGEGSESGSQTFLLVIFDEVKEEEAADTPPIVAVTPDATARRLEEELRYLKTQLRASVEQFEASTEELKASNEELQAMNEEQRSASEELETSREEIQAANEELRTVNLELKLKIEEVSHSNADLQNLMASTDIATVFLSRDLKVKFYTPRAVELFRFIPTDIGRPLADLRHGFGAHSLTEDADRVLRTLATVEREVSSEDGHWFLLRVSPYRTLDDRIDGVVLGFVDITERKRAEELLRGSKERLQTAISIETVGVLFFNNAIEITDCNQAFVQMSGYTREELRAGRFNSQGVAPDGFVQVSSRALEELNTTGIATPYEKEYIRKDGSRFWALFAAKRISENEIVEFVTDITELKRAEAAVRDSEERLRILVESATDFAIFTLDEAGTITSWNAGAATILGFSEAEICGQNAEILFTPEDRAMGAPQKELEAARQTRRAEDDRWHLRKNGERFFASGVLMALPNGLGFVKIARDMTESRELHEQLRRTHDELEARVQERTAALQGEMTQRRQLEQERERLLKGLVSAQEEERRRLSLELHDQMGQTLTALMLGLKSLPDADAPGLSKNLVQLTDELTDQVHHLAWELRPAVLDNVGLEAALRQYVREWSQRNSIAADFVSHRLDDNTRISPDLESTLYRVAQEALNNVVRHARATQVSVLLERRKEEVVAIIEDNGIGFDPRQNTGRLGVVGMRERLEVVGGALTIESALNEGTTIYAHVPFQPYDSPS